MTTGCNIEPPERDIGAVVTSAGAPIAIDDGRIQICLRLLLVMLGAWLCAAAWLVNIEYGDGYSVVANAEYLLGTADTYFWQRGPAMSLWLLPAEWLAQQLDLGPLDVRPHHAAMSALHFAYLIGTWRLLQAHFQRDWSLLLGYVAAVPTLVFFSYAPFISHDLFPGLLVLALLAVSHRFALAPTRQDWLIFLFGCVALVLIKQTYALVPGAILAARLGALALERQGLAEEWRRITLLGCAVAVAGALCWIVYAYLVSSRFPEAPFTQRPLALIAAIRLNYEGQRDLGELFYRWMYLRNASAYGILAMTLVLPGVLLTVWHGNRFSRQLALTWCLLLLAMALTPFKEVRYLAFLAPLNAFLIIPVIRLALAKSRPYVWLLGLVLLIDVARVLPEAMRIRDPYYSHGVTDFFAPLAREIDSSAPIFFGIGWLSFVAPDRDAFLGDPFHRITEMQIDQIRVLYGWARERAFRIPLGTIPAAMQKHPDGLFLLQNVLLAREAPFRRGNHESLPAHFVQTLSRAAVVEFVRSGTGYVPATPSPSPLMLVNVVNDTLNMVIVRDAVDAETLRRFARFDDTPERIAIQVLVVSRLCRLDGCRSFAD